MPFVALFSDIKHKVLKSIWMRDGAEILLTHLDVFRQQANKESLGGIDIVMTRNVYLMLRVSITFIATGEVKMEQRPEAPLHLSSKSQ